MLPTQSETRKTFPVGTGVLDYFPLALAEVAFCSHQGNKQHNGEGTPLRWDRSKSTDEADALIRHFLERGTVDSDGVRHSAKMAWRALALLQKEIEAEQEEAEAPLPEKPNRDPVTSVFKDVYEPPAHAIKDAALVMVDHHENYVPKNKMGLTPDDRYMS